MKWKYGDAWEQFPIENGEIWQAGIHRVMCADWYDPDVIPRLLMGNTVEMLYVDPPWNTALMKSFYTKAEIAMGDKEFEQFLNIMLDRVMPYITHSVFIEMGFQHLQDLLQAIKTHNLTHMQTWDITYPPKRPAHLVYAVKYGSNTIGDCTGMSDDDTPGWAMEQKKPASVIDICAGLGITGQHAFKQNIPSYHIELNKRRIANLLQFYSEQGLTPQRIA